MLYHTVCMASQYHIPLQQYKAMTPMYKCLISHAIMRIILLLRRQDHNKTSIDIRSRYMHALYIN